MQISHPYFQSVVCGERECVVTLSEQFPIRSFRLALVGSQWDGLEMSSDVGFRHPSGETDWIRGHGRTLEEALNTSLQEFLNYVVHPEGLRSADFEWREEIA